MKPDPCLAEIESTLLHEAVSILSADAAQVTLDTPLYNLGLDSLRLFELFVFVEKQFGLSLLEAPVMRENLESIRALARHIYGGLEQK